MAAAAVIARENAPRKTPESDPRLEEQIRVRAHEIWLQRGAPDGSALEDWSRAEVEILSAE